jgi:hypothetical protein
LRNWPAGKLACWRVRDSASAQRVSVKTANPVGPWSFLLANNDRLPMKASDDDDDDDDDDRPTALSRRWRA